LPGAPGIAIAICAFLLTAPVWLSTKGGGGGGGGVGGEIENKF